MADSSGSASKVPNVMKRVDFKADKISEADLEFVQRMTARRSELLRQRGRARYVKRNVAVGCAIAVGVVGVYAYSMLAVKQETFLDDFDSPAAPKT
ncbi:cytochrome c oxidase assembly factor 3, mitochondrial-like [Saccoglossus kowalevskii]